MNSAEKIGTTLGRRNISSMPASLATTLIYLFCFGLFGTLLLRELGHLDQNTEDLARDRGGVLFRLIEITRDWNARHGGVYVPITAETQPNPYLKDPKRDLTTLDGVKLTKVNPAFMTRQIAEIAEKMDGVKFHITSLNPIRPANEADPWEQQALRDFEKGAKERLSFIDNGVNPAHRYMAPLLVKQSCLKCHESQGYKLGDIRGGISITMPAGDLLKIQHGQEHRAIILHLAAALTIALAGHFLFHRSRQHFGTIKALNAQQERLIEDRTQALARTNEELRGEVDERRESENRLRESEERYRTVVEFGTDGVLVTENGLITFANRRLGEMIGRETTEFLHVDGLEIVHPDDRERVARYRENRLRGIPAPTQYRARLQHHDPSRQVVVDFSVKVLENTSSRPPRALVSIRDVTPMLEAERNNRISRAVFENAAEAIIVTDSKNRIVQVNPAFTAITGYTPNEVRGQNPKLLHSGRHDAEFYARLWEEIEARGQWQGEIWNRRKSGDLYIEWLSITRVTGDSGNGGYVATFSDITQRKAAEELIRHKAHHDPLTDLPNRTLFIDRLENGLATARRHERQMALLYVDLDRFKDVNDSLGHGAGDALLIQVAHRLSACLRDSDTVARLGGDEFAMILPEVSGNKDVEDVARRALQSLQAPFILAEGTATISGSIGVALYPDHGDNAELLQRHADAALYLAKAERNAYRVFNAPKPAV